MSTPPSGPLDAADALLADVTGGRYALVADPYVRPTHQPTGRTGRPRRAARGACGFARAGQQRCARCLGPLAVGYDDGPTLVCGRCDWSLRALVAFASAPDVATAPRDGRRGRWPTSRAGAAALVVATVVALALLHAGAARLLDAAAALVAGSAAGR